MVVPAKKINSKIAVEIYKEYLNGESVKNLIKKYNLARNTILNILNKKSWKEDLKNLPMADIKKYNSKLTEKEVIEIYNKYKSGECTQSKLAEKYNVSGSVIYDIIKRKTWKHLNL